MPQLKRTEEEQLLMSPARARLGETEYEIRPLPMRKAAEWRVKFAEEVRAITEHMNAETTGADKFVGGLKFAFVNFPERISDMLFSYAPNLPRETIENEASDEQVAAAFTTVLQLSFPYTPLLGMTATQTRPAAQSR
jgi:hypothetical protein